ncbi:DUF3841 domain-containing protein [Fictibacillus aquaticus]|uniref:DUF3841 domain-containing protein n=1 Tax=Fictibacillus aquaticus TaxID=2021314 RepID=A0A235FDL9_9BACL|nr:DUF3841 domain-containing protein [Fictibacillus aquaticus]OYD59339.1 hypothetical protein CGZ90_05465 [Fictibacillus aquaticus]
MIVQTVMPLELYKIMREQGYYEGNEKYIWDSFIGPYKWMMGEMKKRIPHYDGETYPVWVWQRTVNRNEECLLAPGRRGVILILDIPDEDILWSCFTKWHSILNDFPVTLSEEEWNLFIEKDFKDKEETWSRIFDFELLKTIDPDWYKFEPEWIQGVTPRIEMKHVKKVKRFIAK